MDREEESLTFPIISTKEICGVLHELSLPASIKELHEPTAEFVGPLYEGFVDLLTGYRRDTQRSAPSQIPFPELHQHSIGALGYFKALARLMVAVGVKDFSCIEDLASPDRKRLQRHLSAMINFAKFREEKLETYSQWTKGTDDLLEQKAELEERQNLDHQRLQALREQQKQQEPQILALTEECAQLEKQIGALNVNQASLHDNSSSLKAKNSELLTSIELHKTHISNCENDVVSIRNAIVENPEALADSIKEMTQAIEHERKTTSKIEEDSKGLDRKVKVLTDLQRDVKESVAILRECAEEEKRGKASETEIKETSSQIENVESAIQQLDTEKEILEKQLKNATEKMNRLSKQQKKREKEAERDLDKATAERNRAEAELEQNENRAKDEGKVIEKMEEKLQKLQETHLGEMNKMKDLYNVLEKQVVTYNDDLSQALMGN